MNKEYYIGKKYGRWIIIKFSHYTMNSSRPKWWVCQCECGTIKTILQSSLTCGHSRSCGCFRSERSRSRLKLKSINTNKLPYAQAGFNRLMYRYKKDAKNRNHNFELTDTYFQFLTKQICYYCGNLPNTKTSMGSNGRLNGQYIYNGIDRKNNNLGYTVENSITCCGICNIMKRSLTFEVFLQKIKEISLKHFK